MNAKAVKDILISYLQARNIEIRIYQEKSIGSSICDVMTVTDRLTGYEIKSDLDNYTRLPDQIEAYDKFFDENYLVVGEKHMLSAFERVPDTWGIICVRDSDITVAREAKPNDRVSRRRQLSILWKLELKNLLVKNCMPAFAQKDKGYIADKIVGHVESALLGKQIAQELMRRDYSIYDAADYTIYSGGPDDAEFPAEEIVDVLSEKNLSELTLDKWIALYKQAVAVREQKEAAFRSPDRQRISHAIPYTDIEVSLGVPWVSAEIINDFLYHILGLSVDQGYYHTNFVYYEPITGSWHIYDKNFLGSNVNAYSKYGTNRCKAPHILEATLNLREIKVFDNGKDYNEAETLAALEKQKLIKEEFRRWIWEDEDRRWMVEHAYNELFSKYEKLSFDGSNLTFPSMAEGYGLYPYQKDAVQRILGTKNTLLAFDVGAGKTYIMIAAAMKMREEGISRRNMFVVPNHIVGQWEKLFSQLYPQAKILAIEPKSFKPDMRRKVLEQIRDGDYDGVIIAYSCFEMIPLSVDCVLENMNRQLGRIENALHSLIDRYVRITDWCKVPLSSEKQYIIRLTNEFIASMDAPAVSGISFDELEIDTLFLDEAHNYKNIPIRTKLRNLNGINTKGSKKCMDMLHKVRHVQQHGRGAVFATGTPLCNSISDAYTMQMYLQYDELAEKHLDVFDNWVKTFASPEQLCEIDVDTSRYRFIYRFARFFNLPELSSMFSQTAVFHATAGSEDLPEFSGYTDVVIEKYPELTDYMQKLCERTENIRTGMIDRKFDNMLKVSTDGRKAALDLTLVGEKQLYDESSKVFRCVGNVIELYRKHPDSTQLIFCDYSTPKGEDFSIYALLKEKLIEAGIPGKEIAFIHSYQTESRKVELFRRFNAGEMKILIGSTFKLGIGANVQVKLRAIHHLDVPWRPADMVQREGRILRQGNENKNVLIYRYISQGSFDSYCWQILETKQRFISQFLSGSTYQRTASDLENNVLNYAEVKALALSQPLMKELAQKENEIANLRIIIAKENEARQKAEHELAELAVSIPALKNDIRIAEAHAAFLGTVSDKEFLDETHRISSIFTEQVVFEQTLQDTDVSVFGFDISLRREDSGKVYAVLRKDGAQYSVELGKSAEGNSRRIINKLRKFGKTAEQMNQELNSALYRQRKLTAMLSSNDDSYRRKLAQCEHEAEEIRMSMEIYDAGEEWI